MEDFLEEAALAQGGKGQGWTQREDKTRRRRKLSGPPRADGLQLSAHPRRLPKCCRQTVGLVTTILFLSCVLLTGLHTNAL